MVMSELRGDGYGVADGEGVLFRAIEAKSMKIR